MTVNRSIVMQTCSVYEARFESGLIHTPTHRITFANGCIDGIICLLPNIDMYVMDTVVTLCGLFAILVVSCPRDVIQFVPGERSLAITDIDGIFVNVIGLVDNEMQAVNAVTSELALVYVLIIARGVE